MAVSSFWIAEHETTYDECAAIVRSRCAIPVNILHEWYEDIEDCESLLKIINPNSRPGTDPATDIDFDLAMTLAEFAGLRLMTEEEYLFAATNRGTTQFPWGDDGSRIVGWPNIAQTYDSTITPPGISGLYSGPAEWTLSRLISLPTVPNYPAPVDLSLFRTIRGAPSSAVYQDQLDPTEVQDGPANRFAHPVTSPHRKIGFRMARSVTSPD